MNRSLVRAMLVTSAAMLMAASGVSGTARAAQPVRSGQFVTAPDHASWHQPQQVSASRLVSVTCASKKLCMALATDGEVYTWEPQNGWFGPGTTNLPVKGNVSISCAYFLFCVAVNSGGEYSRDGGTGFVDEGMVDPSAPKLTSVDCEAAYFCVAVSAEGDLLSYDGKSWTIDEQVPGSDFVSVSCSWIHFCLADAPGSPTMVYDGTSWSPAGSTGLGDDTAVSCGTPTFCVAVGGAGNATVFDGTSWGTPTGIEPPGAGLNDVSCHGPRQFGPQRSPYFCMTIDAHGSTVVWQHGHWSQVSHQVFGHQVSDNKISCANARFCIAIHQGLGAIYL